ncbi:MAG TPA: hypothetical protein DIS76_00755 [Rhodospirillaceae bacterium]|nr:hypothetical protein [Rhodospirillaceae bacterium]
MATHGHDYGSDGGACGNGMTSEARTRRIRAAKTGRRVLGGIFAAAATALIIGAVGMKAQNNRQNSGPGGPKQ